MSEKAFKANEVLDLMEELAKEPIPTETQHQQEFRAHPGWTCPGLYGVVVFESESFYDNLGDDHYRAVMAAYERGTAVWNPLREAAVSRWGEPVEYDATTNFKAGRENEFDTDLISVTGSTSVDVWDGPGEIAYAIAAPGQPDKEIEVRLGVWVLDRRLVFGATTGAAE